MFLVPGNDPPISFSLI